MSQTIHLEPNDVAGRKIANVAFPGYNGRKLRVNVHDDGGMTLKSYWDGGSRDYYAVLRLSDMKVFSVPQNGSGFDPYGYGIETKLPAPDFAVVEHSIFCGQDSGITIHVHRENAAKLIPAPTETTWAERVVLTATRSLKSSYAGKSRFDMAADETGIRHDEWETAKAALIARKLLNAAGAITPAGRNASGSKDLYWLSKERTESVAN